jgi:hypothetical protein
MSDDTAESTAGTDDGVDADPVSLAEAQRLALEYADEFLSHPVDNVIEVNADGEGWQVLVEVVERSAVPNTQDILARYEMTIDEQGELSGYGLRERYRRGDARGNL